MINGFRSDRVKIKTIITPYSYYSEEVSFNSKSPSWLAVVPHRTKDPHLGS